MKTIAQKLFPLFVSILCLGGTAFAQDFGIDQTVARVAYVSGDASYSRGDDPDYWQRAGVNYPLTTGDHVYTGYDSRLELQTEGAAIYVAPDSELAALNLREDVRQFSLPQGTASFRVRHLRGDESFEVDTPNASVTFDRPGVYRVDVERDGDTRVSVDRGEADVVAGGGDVPLRSGDMMRVWGYDDPQYEVTALYGADRWDRWVSMREERYRRLDYVSPAVFGAEDLDGYGRWVDVPGYGMVWSPDVTVGWQPYREGRWVWQDPWGWTWVSDEPWGWAPYHYGRWINRDARWYWVPVGPRVVRVSYAPALVAFVGTPAGFSGYVGWFPLAPRDPFVPWWGRAAAHPVFVNNVTYVNRTYITVVNQNTFVSGGVVNRAVIHDERTFRAVANAPVVHGTIPVVPTTASIRTAAPARLRPAPAIVSRPVVARLTPPQVSFEAKARIIAENHGAPVIASQAPRVESVARPAQPIRPALVDSGRVTLVQKPGSAGPAPIPVTSATARPVLTHTGSADVGSKPNSARAVGSEVTTEREERRAVRVERDDHLSAGHDVAAPHVPATATSRDEQLRTDAARRDTDAEQLRRERSAEEAARRQQLRNDELAREEQQRVNAAKREEEVRAEEEQAKTESGHHHSGHKKAKDKDKDKKDEEKPQ